MRKVSSSGAAKRGASLGVAGVQPSPTWRASVCHVLASPWHKGGEEMLLRLCTLLIPHAQGATVPDLVF